MSIMETIEWGDFQKVDLRVGTITRVEDFPEAKRPAYRLEIDFGPELGLRKSSAQITVRYDKSSLVGRQILAVVNLPVKQIANRMSECLVTGVADDSGDIVLIGVDQQVPNGTKLI